MENSNHKIILASTGQIIADKVKIAQDFKSRAIGLLDRNSLEKGEGLVIKPCSSVHTFFMKFPIDVIFLDVNYRVIKIAKSLQPRRLFGCLFGAVMVIELPENTINGLKLQKKDVIKIE